MILEKFVFINFNPTYSFRETQLSKRVNEWTMKLEPVLQKQELAPSFDIHEYSNHILEKFDILASAQSQLREIQNHPIDEEGDISIVQFEEVVAGQPREEVCRAFLATLQLANLGNIEVVSSTEGDGSSKANHQGSSAFVNTFGIKVITTAKQQDIENGFNSTFHNKQEIS